MTFEVEYEGHIFNVYDGAGQRTVSLVLPKKKGKQAKIIDFAHIRDCKRFIDSWNKQHKVTKNEL